MSLRNWWKNRRAIKLLQSVKRTGREIDFTQRSWGHNITKSGDRFAAWCWPRMRLGDLIITELGRFVVFECEPANGVDDMSFFKCMSESKFAARQKGEKGK